MNIRDFEYFHLLARYKSFTHVAQKLNISQPTVTYALKRLEMYFGKELVVRDQAHHMVTITPAGKILDGHIKKILEELALAKRDCQHLEDEKIEIGLPPIIGNYYFTKLSAIFLEKKIDNYVNIVTAGSQDLFRLLKNGKLTLSLVGSTEPVSLDHLSCELLTEKKINIVVSPKHPLAKRSSVNFSELEDEAFIMLNERFVHSEAFKKISQQNHMNPNVVYQSNNLNILKGMIREQLGIGYLTEIAIQENDGLVTIPLLDDPQPKFLISLAQTKATLPYSSQKVIADLIRSMHLD